MIAYKGSDTGNIILKNTFIPDGETSSESVWDHSPNSSCKVKKKLFIYKNQNGSGLKIIQQLYILNFINASLIISGAIPLAFCFNITPPRT
jgi:hypothetical protein